MAHRVGRFNPDIFSLRRIRASAEQPGADMDRSWKAQYFPLFRANAWRLQVDAPLQKNGALCRNPTPTISIKP
jgi:hypothetical protein